VLGSVNSLGKSRYEKKKKAGEKGNRGGEQNIFVSQIDEKTVKVHKSAICNILDLLHEVPALNIETEIKKKGAGYQKLLFKTLE